MKKVKRKNLYGEKISRERTNEYKLGKYVKKMGETDIHWGKGDTNILQRGYRHL